MSNGAGPSPPDREPEKTSVRALLPHFMTDVARFISNLFPARAPHRLTRAGSPCYGKCIAGHDFGRNWLCSANSAVRYGGENPCISPSSKRDIRGHQGTCRDTGGHRQVRSPGISPAKRDMAGHGGTCRDIRGHGQVRMGAELAVKTYVPSPRSLFKCQRAAVCRTAEARATNRAGFYH